MSELKATTAEEIVQNEKECDYMDELFGGVKMPPTQVYLKSEADEAISAKDAEIRRLHRCIIQMTKQWLSAIDDMYSRLDDVHGLDDDDVTDWDKVSDLHDNLDKVLEKWK